MKERDKRERLVACILSGNSKQYLVNEYTEQQINPIWIGGGGGAKWPPKSFC